MFRFYEFCFFLFFVLFRRIDLCIGWLVIFSMSWMLNNEMYSFFLNFWNWYLTFKNEECLFVTVFLTLCRYSSHSSLYLCSFVLAPTFIFGILIFSVVKNEWFRLFLRFSSFLWFAIDFIQHKAVLSVWQQALCKISTYDYLLQLSSGLGNILTDFLPLNILLLMSFLWSIFFWFSMKSCCLAHVQQGSGVCFLS